MVAALGNSHSISAALAEARSLTRWALSVSHNGGMAIAFVVAMSEGLGGAY
jgi:phosphopantetheinyl transferase (holo-ACP synthase)